MHKKNLISTPNGEDSGLSSSYSYAPFIYTNIISSLTEKNSAVTHKKPYFLLLKGRLR